MIKKIFSMLLLQIFIFSVGIRFAYSEETNVEIYFLDKYVKNIVNKINEFRSKDFFEKMDYLGISLGEILDNNSQFVCCLCDNLTLDERLTDFSKKRLIKMISTLNFSHEYISDYMDDFLFSGEAVFGVAFQNSIDVEDFINSTLKKMFLDGILNKNPESILLVYPYDSIGVAVGLSKINLGGVDYNVILVVVEAAIQYEEAIEGYFYGRIFLDSNICSDCKIEIKDLNFTKIGEIITYKDGSFLVNDDFPEKFYMVYGDNYILVNKLSISSRKFIFDNN